MFQFPPFASLRKVRIVTLQVTGLSHSEIRGSKVICTYPRLIAACHVLHRLREPRHPPDALTSFRHCRPTKRAAAHTFSCNLRVLSSTQFVKNKVFTYSFLCVSMSKIDAPKRGLVENIGVEPMTSCMPCKRSSQLS